MRFGLRLSPLAEKQFAGFDEKLRLRVVEKIKQFLENEIEPIKLEGNFKGHYKLRVGDYRVVYIFDETNTIMLVRRIGHRSRVYQDLARDV